MIGDNVVRNRVVASVALPCIKDTSLINNSMNQVLQRPSRSVIRSSKVPPDPFVFEQTTMTAMIRPKDEIVYGSKAEKIDPTAPMMSYEGLTNNNILNTETIYNPISSSATKSVYDPDIINHQMIAPDDKILLSSISSTQPSNHMITGLPISVNNSNNINNEGSSGTGGSAGSDHSISGDIGYAFVISDKLLGHGSYGDVFLANDENGKQVAVKCCDIEESGIPSILEASIMGSMVHPYLNRALRIEASDTKLYIIQELAQTDMAQYTRRDKGNHKPSMEELRRWCFCLAQAVCALHIGDIIHADIKASNVLLYSDGSIRLTDYTLATKKWSSSEKFTHNVCTCTHRPLECLLKRSWDESLDIWSLGCTFYEIAYGELLFPYQGALEADQKAKDRDAKTRLRNRSVNAIIDWSARGPNPPTSYEIIGITQYSIDYIPFVLCSDYNRPEMAVFNDLVCRMLTVDPSKRPTIGQLLAHPFFQGMRGPTYLSIKRPINKISVTEQARVSRYIQRYTSNITVQSLALNIYCRCNDMNNISEHIKAAACTWISSKIVVGYPPKMALPPNQILAAERDICHNLLFRLHTL